jgi:glycosyltransferase involved in cell wall biosynthesis
MWFQRHNHITRGIGVLYFGRRGAGRLFTENIIKSLHDSSKLDIAFVSSSAKFSSANQRTIEIRTPHDYKGFYLVLFFIADVSKAIFRMRRRLPETFILPMASPLDHFIAKILRALGVKIVRIIHDVTPHLGERWPKNNSIRKRILNSDGVVFLTEYVQNECRNQFSQRELKLPPTCVIGHPFFPQNITENVHLPDGFENYSLIIGRIEKYKGIPEFLRWWKTRTTMSDGKLVIAGDGSYSSFLSTLIATNHEDVFFINKWLSDSEFEYLISNAQIIILPYLEATQSGVIPIARYHQVPMLVSNSGGLLQQLAEYTKYEIYDHTVDPSELLHSLLGTNSQDSPRDNSKPLELSVFLTELLNFATNLGE